MSVKLQLFVPKVNSVEEKKDSSSIYVYTYVELELLLLLLLLARKKGYTEKHKNAFYLLGLKFFCCMRRIGSSKVIYSSQLVCLAGLTQKDQIATACARATSVNLFNCSVVICHKVWKCRQAQIIAGHRHWEFYSLCFEELVKGLFSLHCFFFFFSVATAKFCSQPLGIGIKTANG